MANRDPTAPVPMTAWAPAGAFQDKDPVYVLSATHRGDMYHIRAAMQLADRKYSVILYESNPKTVDLENYLSHSTVDFNNKRIFVVPWTLAELTSRTKPTVDAANCSLDKQPYDGTDEATALKRVKLQKYGESEATAFIAQSGEPVETIQQGMALISEESKETLGPKFDNLWRHTWKIEPKQFVILGLYRPTGSKFLGVYPELDSGLLDEIRGIVGNLPHTGGKKLKVVSCGDNIDESAPGMSIGPYWEQFKEWPETKVETLRDLEAYFLEWSFKKNFFVMTTGYRSGGLDLFTFLGVPTVSIGLRNMAGEPRHLWLASARFKRHNVQYDQPRHNTTVFIKNKDKTSKEPVIGSPFWVPTGPVDAILVEPPADALSLRTLPSKPERDDQQRRWPDPLTQFDRIVLEVAYRVACERYINWERSIARLNGEEFPNVIGTTETRWSYRTAESRETYQRDLKLWDTGDIGAMERKLQNHTTTLQQSRAIFYGWYQKVHLDDWKAIVRYRQEHER